MDPIKYVFVISNKFRSAYTIQVLAICTHWEGEKFLLRRAQRADLTPTSGEAPTPRAGAVSLRRTSTSSAQSRPRRCPGSAWATRLPGCRYLPALVMIISVPISWKRFQSSAPCSSTRGAWGAGRGEAGPEPFGEPPPPGEAGGDAAAKPSSAPAERAERRGSRRAGAPPDAPSREFRSGAFRSALHARTYTLYREIPIAGRIPHADITNYSPSPPPPAPSPGRSGTHRRARGRSPAPCRRRSCRWWPPGSRRSSR